MAGGIAHGENRRYQVSCRDVLTFRDPQLTPWAADGIDVPFDLPDTRWTFDVALKDTKGSLVLVECRRTTGAVKQEDVAAFAYKIETVRKALAIPVAGIFIAKREHQIGAIKVAQCNGIQTAILEQDSILPGFNITFLRYSAEREKQVRDFVMHICTGSLAITGYPPTVVQTKLEDGSLERNDA